MLWWVDNHRVTTMRAAKAATSQVNYGLALQQGLREDMEDYAVVVPGKLDRGEYLFAGASCGCRST
jgi:hypothetical protein